MSRTHRAELQPDPRTATSTTSRTVSAGWPLIGCALVLVGYIAVAVTIGADFEHDLEQAAAREGVGVNALATATQAQITHDHALYAVVTSALLFIPPALLLIAVARIASATGAWSANLARWSAAASAVLWWAYLALGLGLFADPDDLPPLVRDFGPLTVPMVTTTSLFALVALALAAECLRTAGVTPRGSRVSAVIAVVVGVLSLVGLVASGFADPVPPIVVVPSALILGIALRRLARRQGA